MGKKILMWTIYAGVVGLLIFGAVIRTEAKTEQHNSQPEMRLESRGSGSDAQGGEGAGWARDGEEGTRSSGQGSGRNGGSSGSGEELLLAADQEHDWTTLIGVVISLDDESLWIETDQEENLEITGRAWSFILESGLVVSIGDQVELEGFYENDEFEVSYLEDLTSGESLQIREDSGRPLWSGGAGH